MSLLSRRGMLVCAASSVLPARAREVSLFDGASTRGWISVTGDPFPERSWSLENGCLKANAIRPKPFHDIRTEAEFDFFELSFEWRLPAGGNSGVKYSIQRVETFAPKGDDSVAPGMHARARGLEFQLGDESTADTRRGLQYSAGALYGLYGPSEPAAVRAGAFNKGRILYTATRLEHWVNGTLVVAADPSSPDFADRIRHSKDEKLLMRPRRAPIVLQNHSSEVWFRKLSLRML